MCLTIKNIHIFTGYLKRFHITIQSNATRHMMIRAAIVDIEILTAIPM